MTEPLTFLVTRRLPEPADAILRDAGHVEYLEEGDADLASRVAQGDALILVTQLLDRVDAALLDSGRVLGVSNYAAGVDNVDLDAAEERGVPVGHTPDVLTDDTADVAMLLMLAAMRRLSEGDALMRSGGYTGWRPDLLLGSSARGARLGLVGGGRIAAAVARRAKAFGMTTVWASVSGADPATPRAIDEHADRVSLDDLIESSDVVSLHAPLSARTHHLFGRAEFARMKSSAVIVNTARGALIDEAALVDALRVGEIAGAGLDVYEAEPDVAPGLVDLPNVVLLPHLGSATRQTRAEMASICARNAVAIATGAPLPRQVPPRRTAATRSA